MDRRSFLRSSVAVSTFTAGFGPSFWRAAYAAPARPGPGPYGPLGLADENGVLLPVGFTARIIAAALLPVSMFHSDSTDYIWHVLPDGGACYPTEDGGWIYASNSEVPAARPFDLNFQTQSEISGGASAVRFAPDGTVVDAYRILDGTRSNCAGGSTPWGTWLSCEETDGGLVWECDPYAPGQGVVRPAMGAFAHEAVAVDPVNEQLYLTEDDGASGFYRFTPTAYPDLSDGLLEIAVCDGPAGGAVTWVAVPDPSGESGRTAEQVAGANIFHGGEGVWYDEGFVYHTTKDDNRVWVYCVADQRMFVLYDAADHAEAPLAGVDNVTVAPSGDVLVAEDLAVSVGGTTSALDPTVDGTLDIVLISADKREVAPIVRLEGPQHQGSEICGPAFSPDGTRLYFSSQRSIVSPGTGMRSRTPGSGPGVTFEVTGPFRRERVGIAAIGASGTPEPLPGSAPGSPSGRLTSSPEPVRGPLPSTGGGRLSALGLGAVALGAILRRRSEDGRHGEPHA